MLSATHQKRSSKNSAAPNASTLCKSLPTTKTVSTFSTRDAGSARNVGPHRIHRRRLRWGCTQASIGCVRGHTLRQHPVRCTCTPARRRPILPHAYTGCSSLCHEACSHVCWCPLPSNRIPASSSPLQGVQKCQNLTYGAALSDKCCRSAMAAAQAEQARASTGAAAARAAAAGTALCWIAARQPQPAASQPAPALLLCARAAAACRTKSVDRTDDRQQPASPLKQPDLAAGLE